MRYVVSQAVCAIFEKSVKTLLHDFAPMVSQLSEMLGQMYSTIPQASALDLTRQVNTSAHRLKYYSSFNTVWLDTETVELCRKSLCTS